MEITIYAGPCIGITDSVIKILSQINFHRTLSSESSSNNAALPVLEVIWLDRPALNRPQAARNNKSE